MIVVFCKFAAEFHKGGLDAAPCLYIASLYAGGSFMERFGDMNNGYIAVPQKYVPDD